MRDKIVDFPALLCTAWPDKGNRGSSDRKAHVIEHVRTVRPRLRVGIAEVPELNDTRLELEGCTGFIRTWHYLYNSPKPGDTDESADFEAHVGTEKQIGLKRRF